MAQVARNLTDATSGFLRSAQYLTRQSQDEMRKAKADLDSAKALKAQADAAMDAGKLEDAQPKLLQSFIGGSD